MRNFFPILCFYGLKEIFMKRFAIMALALTFLTGTIATVSFAQDAPKKEKKKKGKKKKGDDDKK